jgi:prepilin-type N-terminal cleavage/methylation domain-containing protein
MKGERGFTLLESVLTIAITGFIVAVLSLTVQQIVTVPEKGGAQTNAVHSVQNAAHWMTLDGQTALSAVGGDDLTLTLPGGSVISYTLDGTELKRTYASKTQTLADDISSVNFDVQDRTIYMTIVATPESRWGISENQTYQVYMRPTG